MRGAAANLTWVPLAALYHDGVDVLCMQDTVKDQPGMSSTQAMKKAVNVSVAVITAFFLAVGIAGEQQGPGRFLNCGLLHAMCYYMAVPDAILKIGKPPAHAGYLAFGNEVPDNLLTAFTHPLWYASWKPPLERWPAAYCSGASTKQHRRTANAALTSTRW